MKLVTSNDGQCVAASLAMVLGKPLDYVVEGLGTPGYPFPPPWDNIAKVPGMDEIVDWLYNEGVCAIPFTRDPQVTPSEDCPAISAWAHPEAVFQDQLKYGSGLIEGLVHAKGHMVAWDGEVFDPRGYRYQYRLCTKYGFEPRRFWLCI